MYIRRGAENRLIDGGKVTHLALAKGAASYEDQLLDKFTVTDLVKEPGLARFLPNYSPQTGYRRLSYERANPRNGYRQRTWDTRVGTVDLPIPKVQAGTYLPDAQ